MTTLSIHWQRLLSQGQTCPRCGSTEAELDRAVAILRQSLTPLGIEVLLEKGELSVSEFKQDTLQSNSIRINDRRLEDWLGARSGQSQCCDICGPNDCRTLEFEDEILEVVPADLIVKAGLLAVAQRLGQGQCGCAPGQGEPCCSNSRRLKNTASEKSAITDGNKPAPDIC